MILLSPLTTASAGMPKCSGMRLPSMNIFFGTHSQTVNGAFHGEHGGVQDVEAGDFFGAWRRRRATRPPDL